MGALLSRTRMIVEWYREWQEARRTPNYGDPTRGTVFILDGVGGLLMAPLCVRRGLRQAGVPWAIEIFDWHSGPRGELLYDLMAYRHNRRKAAAWADLVAQRRADFARAPLHVVACSGGTGFAAFGLEQLPDGVMVDTVVMACSALSPRYRLTGMLRHVRRCVALVSRHDWGLIGIGTTLFGTMDRQLGRSAGMLGFRRPQPFGEEDARQYAKLHQLFWEPSMRAFDHYGHHVGWVTPAFARHYLVKILNDQIEARMHIGPVAK